MFINVDFIADMAPCLIQTNIELLTVVPVSGDVVCTVVVGDGNEVAMVVAVVVSSK